MIIDGFDLNFYLKNYPKAIKFYKTNGIEGLKKFHYLNKEKYYKTYDEYVLAQNNIQTIDNNNFKISITSVLILLLTYNRPQKCINVIKDILNQTYTNYKLLVIDDGSLHDNFIELSNFIKNENNTNITLLKNEVNKKIPATINIGIKYFLDNNYDYFTWISDDNVYYKNFIELMIDDNYDFISSSYDLFIDDINKQIKQNNNYSSPYNIINKFEGLASFMWSKKAIETIGFFNENLYRCEDFDYNIRTFLMIDNIKFVDQSTMKYIDHNDSLYSKEYLYINRLSRDIKFIYNKLLINTKLFIYFSKNSWNLLFQRPHQICRFMNNKYLKIFISCDNILKYEEQYNLLIISYKYRNIITNLFNYEKYDEKIIYYTDPRLFDEINNYSNKCKILFDLIDAPINEFIVWKPNLENAVNNADVVMYSHPKLVKFLNEINPEKEYHYVSNGCDYEHFSKAKERIYPKPNDIPVTNNSILGYYGAFSEWLDYDLIRKYADEGEYHILMIGGITNNPSYNRRFEHPNITWLNHKNYNELPIYLSWFDKCLIPFKECELTKYVNPCKLWEYMASDKEIIKHGININSNKLITYLESCNYLENIIK